MIASFEKTSTSTDHVNGPPFLNSIATKNEWQGSDRFNTTGINLRGTLTPNAPLAPLVWFKAGGAAEYLFEPQDCDDLRAFIGALPSDMSLFPLGLGSNLIVRDGGLPGVTVRLGKAFADVAVKELSLSCGAGASGIKVASAARDAGIAGLEFLRGIPGTIGGAVCMNAGAYGSEMSNILVSADLLLRSGELVCLRGDELGFSYRHSRLPAGAIIVAARLQGTFGDPRVIGAKMDQIAVEREAAQPLRSKTGGSTFKNPPGRKAWALIDAAGCRGLRRGGAQVSEKHTNFLINFDGATSSEIESLGDEVRTRVLANSGIDLEWEIQRVGMVVKTADLPSLGQAQ